MTYFECTECGELGRFLQLDRREFHATCPRCDAETRWTVAFDDREQGVSF